LRVISRCYAPICVATANTPYAPSASLEDYADDVHALRTDLNFAPCAVAGFCFRRNGDAGAGVKYPQDVRALVVASCTSAQTPESAKAVAARGTDAKRDGIASLLDVTMQRWLNDAFRLRGGDTATRARPAVDRCARLVRRLAGDGGHRYGAAVARDQGADAVPRRRIRQVDAAAIVKEIANGFPARAFR